MLFGMRLVLQRICCIGRYLYSTICKAYSLAFFPFLLQKILLGETVKLLLLSGFTDEKMISKYELLRPPK